MKFKIDENLPAELATDLRNLGHEAETVFAEVLTGATDPVVIKVASQENRILLTLDKGIANLQRYPADLHAGVVLFRAGRSGRQRAGVHSGAPLELLDLDLQHRVTIVGASRIRVR